MSSKITKEDQIREALQDITEHVDDFKESMVDEDWQEIFKMIYKPKVHGPYDTGVILEYHEEYEKDTFRIPSTRAIQKLLILLEQQSSFLFIEDSLEAIGVDIRTVRMHTGNLTLSLLERDDTNIVVDIFVDEFFRKPTRWNVRVALLGVKLRQRELSFGDMILRFPEGYDFPHSVSITYGQGSPQPAGIPPQKSKMVPVSTFLTWIQDGIPRGRIATDEIIKKVKEITRQLRLLKTSRFVVTGWDGWTNSITEKGHLFANVIPQKDLLQHRYSGESFTSTKFGEEERRNYSILKRKVFAKRTRDHKILRRLETAIWAYEEISERSALECVLFIIIGLESLFLISEGELSLRLATRTASLLKYMGNDPLKVYNDVRSAYRVRNKFVHGGKLENELDEARRLLLRLIEYLRQSILVLYQIPIEKMKVLKEFLETLDSVHFDNEGRTNSYVQKLLTGLSVFPCDYGQMLSNTEHI